MSCACHILLRICSQKFRHNTTWNLKSVQARIQLEVGWAPEMMHR